MEVSMIDKVEFINEPERDLHYNRIGGVNGFKEVDGELLEFTLSDEEVSLIDESTEIKPFNAGEYNSKVEISNFKLARESLLKESKVTTASGKSFDADEQAQDRMMRAIIRAEYRGIDDSEIVPWSTADVGTGEIDQVTIAELREAHALAIEQMAEIWLKK